MSLGTARPEQPEQLDSADVDAYLRRHPDFFQHHLALLETLKLPHPCGDAVSLVSRQLDLLREKNRKLQSQLDDILQIARENDALSRRMHQLTLTVLDATSLDDALASLRWLLHECFQADYVAVRLVEPVTDSPISNLYLSADAVDALRSVLDGGSPQCGAPVEAESALMFGDDAADVRSCALVPLHHAGLKGLLAIGSRNADRFEEGMGSLFLSQMGEIIAARLATLLVGRD